jgi:hypothetical protein
VGHRRVPDLGSLADEGDAEDETVVEAVGHEVAITIFENVEAEIGVGEE